MVFNGLHNERGIYIPLLTFVILALLAASCMVIDLGTVARSQVQIQRAADAGVLAGLAYRIDNRQEVDPEDAIVARARRFAEQNMIQLGHDPTRAVWDVEYKLTDPDGKNQETLVVKITYDAPLLIMTHIPFHRFGNGPAPGNMRVFGTSKGAIPPSNIVMVLDTSNSMACPGSGPCPCQTAGVNCNVSPGSGAKIYELRTGVYKFLENFREGYDRISLVSFDVVAETLVPFNPNGFQLQDFRNQLGLEGSQIPDKFLPGGMTNPSDGLSEAFQELKRRSFIQPTGKANEPVAIVFFTDGAPSAADVCFSDDKLALPPSPAQATDPGAPALCPAGSKRYTEFEVEWVNVDADGIEQRVRVASPLVKREAILGMPKAARLPENILMVKDPNTGELVPNTDAFPPCSRLVAASSASEARISTQNALNDCLGSLSYAMPDSSIENSGQDIFQYKQLFYHRGVSIADYLRRNNFLLYAIGLGTQAPVEAKTDIYEDYKDDFVRKNGFLISLTNHTDLAQGELYNQDTGEYSAFPYPEFQSWEDRVNDKRGGKTRDGYYLESSDPARIGDMFNEVARRIQMRIVQ